MKVTDFEIGRKLSKALKDAGYHFETYHFIRIELKVDSKQYTKEAFEQNLLNDTEYGSVEWIPAFTMCEIWDMLPEILLDDRGCDVLLEISPICVCYATASGRAFSDSDMPLLDYDGNVCNALANLVMWCIEEGHELNLPKK